MNVSFKGDRFVHSKYIIFTRTNLKMKKTNTKYESILHLEIVLVRADLLYVARATFIITLCITIHNAH